MKRLENTSVCRIALFLFLISIINSKILFIVFLIYEFLCDWKESFIFLIICIITFFSYYLHSIINIDFNSYNPIIVLIENRINEYSLVSATALNKILLNINYYDTELNVGYGISFYYFVKIINKINRKYSLLFVLMNTILFGFQLKYLIILSEYILIDYKINETNSKPLLIIFIIILVPNFRNNYSILFYILIKLYSIIRSNFSFVCFLSIVDSLLFGKVTISVFLYKYTVYLKITMYIISIITLFNLKFDKLYSLIICVYSKLNNIFDIGIRGKVSIFSMILILLIISNMKNINTFKQMTLLMLLLVTPINNPFFYVSFIDIGQGDAILIHDCLNKGNVLIDTGSAFNYYKLKKYLFSKGIYTIDYLIITHNDEDHCGNIESLNNDFKIINTIYEGKDVLFNNISLHNIRLKEFDNDNDNSLVYCSKFNDLNFLFTGDISSLAETELIKQYREYVDILKVSHHGSKYSTSSMFISSILPRFSIISTNGKYGHPSNECINTLDKYRSTIFITKDNRDIEFILTYIASFVKTGSGHFAIIN